MRTEFGSRPTYRTQASKLPHREDERCAMQRLRSLRPAGPFVDSLDGKGSPWRTLQMGAGRERNNGPTVSDLPNHNRDRYITDAARKHARSRAQILPGKTHLRSPGSTGRRSWASPLACRQALLSSRGQVTPLRAC